MTPRIMPSFLQMWVKITKMTGILPDAPSKQLFYTSQGLKTMNPKRAAFEVTPLFMGVRPGQDYDNIEALLEELEGPGHR